MKKTTTIAVLCMVILSLSLCLVLTACNNNKVNGKYFLEKSDGTLDESSWIELLKKNEWQDDAGETGTIVSIVKKMDTKNTVSFFVCSSYSV